MRVRSFDWDRASDPAARAIASEVREWACGPDRSIALSEIAAEVAERGDAALADLTARFDATELVGPDESAADARERWRRPGGEPWRMRVGEEQAAEALAGLDHDLRASLDLAAGNIEKVAEAQLGFGPHTVSLPQGHQVTVREVPVGAAGIYVPGGGASYPSSLLMAAIPAQVAGVARLAVTTPPGPAGQIDTTVLAAAALCGIEEIYAVGGAQAVFALARGTESIEPVDVIAGPGSDWVQAAKREVFGEVGIDSIAGPSELMVAAGPESDPAEIALDLCAQAEHGEGGLLLVTGPESALLERIADEVTGIASGRAAVADAPLALVSAGEPDAIAELADAIAPEHLQVDLDRDRAEPGLPGPVTRALVAGLTRPGCVFAGPCSATAFGDYVAGSNHILPTGGAGRFSGPLGPSTFLRRISNVVVGPDAAAELAPHVDRIARAEGLPVHGESAMARRRSTQDDAAGGRMTEPE